MREPDLETVNRTLSAVVQKQDKELKMLRKALLDAADKLDRHNLPPPYLAARAAIAKAEGR